MVFLNMKGLHDHGDDNKLILLKISKLDISIVTY